MLEGLAASILSKYLGAYVDGLQKENLSLSVGAGDVVLEHLELKKEALQELDLPVTVRAGTSPTPLSLLPSPTPAQAPGWWTFAAHRRPRRRKRAHSRVEEWKRAREGHLSHLVLQIALSRERRA